MRPIISVPKDMKERIRAFLQTEGIVADVISSGECDIRIVRTMERLESDENTLQAGGWIKCAVACGLAGKLNTSTRKIGKLLDLLDIKVRECGLGCF